MYKYILYSIPRFYLYAVLYLLGVTLIAFAVRYVVHDYMLALLEVQQDVPTEEDQEYVAMYELPDDAEETQGDIYTPNGVIHTAAGGAAEEMGLTPPSSPSKELEAVTNAQIAMVDRLNLIMQRDLPVAMLAVEQFVFEEDLSAIVTKVSEVQAAVAKARLVSGQIRRKTDELGVMAAREGISAKETSAVGVYQTKTRALITETDKLLDMYDVVYSDARVDALQLPSRAEVDRVDTLEMSVSEAFAEQEAAIQTLLDVIL